MNPLFNAMGGNTMMNGPMGKIQNLMSQVRSFRNSFKGDPNQEFQKWLNSPQGSQEMYNQAATIANQIAHMMGK